MASNSFNFGYMRDWGNTSPLQNTMFNDNVMKSAGGAYKPSFMEGMLGYTNPNSNMQIGGWGNLALGAGQGLLGAYMGMKQYGIAKEQLAESRRQFDKNFATQKRLTNTRLEDRQRARVASSTTGQYQDVDSYMEKNKVR